MPGWARRAISSALRGRAKDRRSHGCIGAVEFSHRHGMAQERACAWAFVAQLQDHAVDSGLELESCADLVLAQRLALRFAQLPPRRRRRDCIDATQAIGERQLMRLKAFIGRSPGSHIIASRLIRRRRPAINPAPATLGLDRKAAQLTRYVVRRVLGASHRRHLFDQRRHGFLSPLKQRRELCLSEMPVALLIAVDRMHRNPLLLELQAQDRVFECARDRCQYCGATADRQKSHQFRCRRPTRRSRVLRDRSGLDLVSHLREVQHPLDPVGVRFACALAALNGNGWVDPRRWALFEQPAPSRAWRLVRRGLQVAQDHAQT
jgi:hypothetical protein